MGGLTARSMLIAIALAATTIGCDTQRPEPVDERQLTTLDEPRPEDPRDVVMARQHELLEALDDREMERVAELIDMSFHIYDDATPADSLASADEWAWRPMPGDGYFEFLASDIPPDVQWSGRTIEIAWITPTVTSIVTHIDETDPVFTTWQLRDGVWKATLLVINAPDEALQRVRESRERQG